MKKPIRVLLADDHAIVRMGLKSLLEDEPDIAIVGEASDGAIAVTESLRLMPDVVVMDLMMPRKDGNAATAEIVQARPETRVLILTTFSTSDGISRALENGASGALLKNVADLELLPAIRELAAGRTYVSQEIQHLLADDPPVKSLTDRQREILESVTRGFSNGEIAKQFGITEITVRNHLSMIFSKIGAATRAEAVAIALRKQLLKM